jgi:hypothetical protein
MGSKRAGEKIELRKMPLSANATRSHLPFRYAMGRSLRLKKSKQKKIVAVKNIPTDN